MPRAQRHTLESAHTTAQDKARIALSLVFTVAGVAHLTFARKEIQAAVPPWLPCDADAVVVQSGIAEIALGAALLAFPQQKKLLGKIAAGFLVAVFPGNIAQYTHRRSAFGLDTDSKRLARLFFQPALIGWALWSTGALRASSNN